MGSIFQIIFALSLKIFQVLIVVAQVLLQVLIKALIIPFQLLCNTVGIFWAIIIYLIVLSSIMGSFTQV